MGNESFGMEDSQNMGLYSLLSAGLKHRDTMVLGFFTDNFTPYTADEKEGILGRSKILGVPVLVVDHLYH